MNTPGFSPLLHKTNIGVHVDGAETNIGGAAFYFTSDSRILSTCTQNNTLIDGAE
jgi:hypothetical protein